MNNADNGDQTIQIAPSHIIASSVTNVTRHEEVHMSENDWEKIRDKIKKIEIKKPIGVFQLILVSLITTSIDSIYIFIDSGKQDFTKTTIIGVALILFVAIERIFKGVIYDISVHQTHLQDIKDWIGILENSRSKNI